MYEISKKMKEFKNQKFVKKIRKENAVNSDIGKENERVYNIKILFGGGGGHNKNKLKLKKKLCFI